MAKSVAGVSVNVAADTTKLQSGLDLGKKSLKGFEKASFNAGLKVELLSAVVRKLTGAAIGLAKKGIGAVTEQFDKLDKIGKTSTKLGIATDQLQRLQFAGEESGVAADAMSTSIQRMTRRLADAARSGGPLADRLKELNLDATSMAMNTPDQNMLLLADAFAGVGNQAEKTSIAMQLFDTEGVALVNTLQGGSAALQEQMNLADQLGITLNGVDVANVEKMNDSLGRVGKLFEGIAIQIAAKVAPFITSLSDRVVAWWIDTVNAQKFISKGFNVIIKVVGFVADGFEALKIIWQALKVGFNFLLLGIVKGLEATANLVIKVGDLFGFDLKDSFLGDAKFLVQALNEELDANTKTLEEMWLAPLPSQKIKNWADDVATAVNRAKVEDKLKTIEIPAVTVAPGKDKKTKKTTTKKTGSKTPKEIDVNAGAILAGSASAFEAIFKTKTDVIQEKQLDKQTKTADELVKVNSALANMQALSVVRLF